MLKLHGELATAWVLLIFTFVSILFTSTEHVVIGYEVVGAFLGALYTMIV